MHTRNLSVLSRHFDGGPYSFVTAVGPSLRPPSAPGSLVRPSVRRIKRWCHIRTKPFNQIDYGDSRAAAPVADEDDGEQEMAKEDREEEAVVAVRSFAWIQEVQLA